VTSLRQQLDQKKHEIANLNASNRDIRNNLKDAQYAAEKDRRELMDRLSVMEG